MTLPIVANDRPLTFSDNVLSTWYPCSTRALELHDMALDRATQHERANVLALETTRPVSTKVTHDDKNERELTVLKEKLAALNKKLRRAKIIQENLDRDDDFDDSLTRKKDVSSGFAAELADDI